MRPLRAREIAALRANGCRASDWREVFLAESAENFSPENFRDVEFSGRVLLGARARIERAALRDIDIGDGAVVRGAHFAGQTEPSAFGGGERAHCLAEDGARSVPLWRGLSSQWAHLLLHYKNTPAADALERLAAADIRELSSARSRIGNGCRVENCGTLRNVLLEDGAVVGGASSLADVHAASSADAPVRIGEGVSAEKCVFQKGSEASGGVRLSRCLVGEGARLTNAFAAEHSLFFANADFALGEALAVFAGPFSVSHHRAALVLACQTSFSNFGSGSNASNHHFKLGPRHGGLLRRGTRCGSGSYILWPSDIGAFTTVVGRHARSLDTAAFPFSLLTSEGEKSILVPGANLFTAGLFRDEMKWAARDRRGEIAVPRDLYETAVLSPYTLEAAERGLALLRAHRQKGGGDFAHGGAVIPASRVEAGIVLYETAILYYAGRTLLESAEARRETTGKALPEKPSEARMKKSVKADSENPADAAAGGDCGKWRDWCGLLLPGARAESFLRDLSEEKFPTAESVDARLRTMRAAYAEDALRWAQKHRHPECAEKFPEAADFVFARQMKDAAKEFSPESAYGFGPEEDAQTVFRRLRGTLEDDPAVRQMRDEHARLRALHASS